MTIQFNIGDKVRIANISSKTVINSLKNSKIKNYSGMEGFVKNTGSIWTVLDIGETSIIVTNDCLELIENEPEKQMVELDDVIAFMLKQGWHFFAKDFKQKFEKYQNKVKHAINLLESNNYTVTKK